GHVERTCAHRFAAGAAQALSAHRESLAPDDPLHEALTMAFPLQRPRRLRQTEVWRRMVQETRLSLDSMIYPLFIVPGKGVRHAVESMPTVFQLSVDEIANEAKRVADLGIPA